MAHGREELRLGGVGGFRAPARLVGDELLLLELGDERILLGAVLEHRQRGCAQPAGEEQEVEVDADRHGGEREVERVVEQ